MLKMDAKTWGLIVLLSLVWGGSFLFARIAVQEIPPLTLAFLRVLIAALVLNVLLWTLLKRPSSGPLPWRDFAVMGVLNNIIPFSLIFYGQQEIGAGLAAIINAMTPIWTVIIAHFATADESFTINKTVGVILGFSGVTVLIGLSALSGLTGSTIAQIAVLGATISYGFAGVFGKRFADLPSEQTARGQLTMSTILLLPLMLLIESPWELSMPSKEAIWSVVLLAVLSTALAYVLFFQILIRAGAVNLSLVTFLIPVSAIALGAVFLGETFHTREILGTGLILLGLIVIDGRLIARIRR